MSYYSHSHDDDDGGASWLSAIRSTPAAAGPPARFLLIVVLVLLVSVPLPLTQERQELLPKEQEARQRTDSLEEQPQAAQLSMAPALPAWVVAVRVAMNPHSPFVSSELVELVRLLGDQSDSDVQASVALAPSRFL
jgi:hypothetical protein